MSAGLGVKQYNGWALLVNVAGAIGPNVGGFNVFYNGFILLF